MCEAYNPETIIFLLDACEDPGADPSRHAARLELLKQCIGMFAQAKSRVNANHKYGLAVIRDTVQWEGGAVVTASPEGLMSSLRAVQPAVASASQPQPPLDLGAVVSLLHPLAVAEEADGARVRVILLYCRSTVLPVWVANRNDGEGLCMDVLFVHDRAAAAAAAAAAGQEGCPMPQDVYSWLEDNVDELSGRCGHSAYILESGGHLAKKVTNHMISLVAHPAQRPHQSALRTVPLDLAAMPPQPTSATASTASTATVAAATAPTATATTGVGASTATAGASPPAASASPLADAATGYNPLFNMSHIAAPAPSAAARPSGTWGSPRWPDPSATSPPAPPAPSPGAGSPGLPPSYAAGHLEQRLSAGAGSAPGLQPAAIAPLPVTSPGAVYVLSSTPPPPYRPPGTVVPPSPGAGAVDTAARALTDLSLGPPQGAVGAGEVAAAGAGYATWPHAGAADAPIITSPYWPPPVYTGAAGQGEAGQGWPLPPPPAAAPPTAPGIHPVHPDP